MSTEQARGSARVSRAGFGVAPKRTFPEGTRPGTIVRTRKAGDGEDAIASTRNACATQIV